MYDVFAHNFGTAVLLKHLTDVRSSVEKLINLNSEPEATNLLEQIKDLIAVTTSIDDLATQERRKSSEYLRLLSPKDHVYLQSVNSSTAAIVQDCVELIEPLRGGLDDLRSTREREAVEIIYQDSRLAEFGWFRETFQDLQLRTAVLQVMLSAMNFLRHKNDTDEEGNISAEARSLASMLQYEIASVKPKLHGTSRQRTEKLQRALAAAIGVTLAVPMSLNKHFILGRSVKSFYTGRERQMAQLKEAFEDTAYSGQKRFVIFGLGGSGKTELALKFAVDFMQNYWGVFFLDGSSRKSAAGSYSEIAKIGGVEPNEKAAKNWLTTRALPWLLIIDNADDDEVQLDDLLPPGLHGSILVTSRNPAHKSYGTVGQRYLELQSMERGEANELILRAAEEPTPYATSAIEAASNICSTLGFLPLALIHAAKAILLGLCTWHGYLPFYERHIQRIRHERLQQRSRSPSQHRKRSNEDDHSMNVFSSYEILYQSLESSHLQSYQDAVELLHLFSYLHFQNIRLDIFINAANNPSIEADYTKKEAIELQNNLAKLRKRAKANHESRTVRSISWSKWLRTLVHQVLRHFDTPALLPAILKCPDGLDAETFREEIQDRLNMALAVLVSRSLVMKLDRHENRCSMHPLVHKWVRERPEMSASQQALWCQLAATTLATSVLFPPPLGNTEFDRSMRRELRQHVIHVRECQRTVDERLMKNRALRRSVWPVIETNFGRHRAVEAVRFSRIYSECTDYNEAFQLQSKVRTFVVNALGEDHQLSITISLLLAGSLWDLSRVSECTKLLRRLYEICAASLGLDHPLSLKVSDSLASILFFQGHLAESLALHQATVDGMVTLYGEENENTLKAKNNLARVHRTFMDDEKAAELHLTAWEGMRRLLGEAHMDTLDCLEGLAMTRLRLDAKYHIECHDHMQFILDERRKTLGKEQNFTLIAVCNLGQVKSALGHHEEAAKIMEPTIRIAERNLDEDHFGISWGKCHYGRVLVQLQRYEEAEEILTEAADMRYFRKVTDGGEHPDRIFVMWCLASCFKEQKKFREALETCELIVQALQSIGRGGTKHKMAEMVHEEIAALKLSINSQLQASEP
ncbi:hypothetical protein NA57DRAFT_78947 [Rhizodiscina lignyota]|uniref:NB-ARC domain-containing protein n=1 Tax=Rhizodiscina lignyota TaxID=1504668 RepID=A0A9P4M2Z2_9PEZI|nr:hypothetical protein NA57DRAFT_78947 [Rhizodiscina lignyota]